MKSRVAVFDGDFVAFQAAAAGCKAGIIATNKITGDTHTLNSRTELWGHHGKKAGGILAELNVAKDSPFMPDDYDIEDTVTISPLAHVLHSAKMMVDRTAQLMGATEVSMFIGGKESYRLDGSTLMKYKDRPDNKPEFLPDVEDYLLKRYKGVRVNGIETDDRIIMEAYEKPDHVVVAVDKDARSQPVFVWDYNHPELGIIDCRGLGKLWLDDKKKVRGYGFLHLMFQVCSGDTVDTYKPHCHSNVRWGATSAFKALAPCQNFKEALEVSVGIFKKLYPEPKEITGWRGDKFEIDWMYVANEMFFMARMLRYEGDVVTYNDVLDVYKVKY